MWTKSQSKSQIHIKWTRTYISFFNKARHCQIKKKLLGKSFWLKKSISKSNMTSRTDWDGLRDHLRNVEWEIYL